MKRIFTTAVITMAVLSVALAQKRRSDQGERITPNPATSASRRNSERSIRHIRVTADDIVRLPDKESYVVDLTRGGLIYTLDSTSHRIDFSRVKLRSTTDDVVLETWLRRRLPQAISDRWMSGRIRVGAAKDFSGLNPRQPRPSGLIKYEYDPETDTYTCQGESDCDKMFEDGVCRGAAVCGDTIPNQPACICAAA